MAAQLVTNVEHMLAICMDYAWIVHGSCLDYAWIFPVVIYALLDPWGVFKNGGPSTCPNTGLDNDPSMRPRTVGILKRWGILKWGGGGYF